MADKVFANRKAVTITTSCLYAELGDVDAMIAMATETMRADYGAWKQMRDEPMLRAAVGDDDRWAAAFAGASDAVSTAQAIAADDDQADDDDDDDDDEDDF